jgi:hypothetical protein
VGPGSVIGVLTRRDVVDHALQRRARLVQLRSGQVAAAEVCDAHPHLLLAARHYGTPTEVACPICGDAQLTEVHFVYGDSLGQVAGQAKRVAELERMAQTEPAFRVYEVEVCSHCRWNHLIRSFVLGTDGPPARRTRRKTDPIDDWP